MITGLNEIVRLRFDNGMELRCTPGHKIFTTNRGYVEAQHLTAEDRVKVLDLPAPAVTADWRLPGPTQVEFYGAKGIIGGLSSYREVAPNLLTISVVGRRRLGRREWDHKRHLRLA